jgi:hypothetical protein
MREDVRHESPRTHPHESSVISLMAGWAQQGVQSYFATQKILVDLVMRQPSTMISALQEQLSDTRHSPATVLTELAGEGISNFMDAQKLLLDLVQQQNEIVMAAVEERVDDSSAAVAITGLLRQRIDTAIEMQREFLKIAGKQTRAWLAEAQAGKVPRGSAVADLARDAMDSFVSAEKQFLDAVAEEAKRVAHGKPATRQARKTKKHELVELGRRATETFVEAQKAMVDVGARQMNANLKVASKTMDMLSPLAVPPIAQWTRDGMKGVVEIQEAVVDAVTKPRNGSRPATKKHRKA